MKEIWTQGLEIPRFPQLDGDTSTEILVIGGGMAGILCARELQSRGIECLLVEGNTIGSGITSGTTAVLSTLPVSYTHLDVYKRQPPRAR